MLVEKKLLKAGDKLVALGYVLPLLSQSFELRLYPDILLGLSPHPATLGVLNASLNVVAELLQHDSRSRDQARAAVNHFPRASKRAGARRPLHVLV
jgi:hypothetical protein